MSTHTFRNPDIVQVLDYREFIRDHCPNASQGFVALDLDLLIRHYGHEYGTDAEGKFRLIEIKRNNARPTMAQQRTFRLIDEMLRSTSGDHAHRYEGFFVINTEDDWDDVEAFTVNGQTLSREQFIAWLNGEPSVEPMWSESIVGTDATPELTEIAMPF